jgi:hypothetical protein
MGKVLKVGGVTGGLGRADIAEFNPLTGQHDWRKTLENPAGRGNSNMTILPTGDVLLTGWS